MIENEKSIVTKKSDDEALHLKNLNALVKEHDKVSALIGQHRGLSPEVDEFLEAEEEVDRLLQEQEVTESECEADSDDLAKAMRIALNYAKDGYKVELTAAGEFLILKEMPQTEEQVELDASIKEVRAIMDSIDSQVEEEDFEENLEDVLFNVHRTSSDPCLCMLSYALYIAWLEIITLDDNKTVSRMLRKIEALCEILLRSIDEVETYKRKIKQDTTKEPPE